MRDKPAILVAAFGTSYSEAREVTIDVIVKKTKDRFPGHEVRQAFTSEMIIRKLRQRDKVEIDNPQQALERLQRDGFHSIVIQPLHIVPGHEWKKVLRAVRLHRANFDHIALGRPVLYFCGSDNTPDDYRIAVEALRPQLPELGETQAVVLMAHGTCDPANACYVCFERVLHETGISNVFLASVEGYPSLASVKTRLKSKEITEVTLIPFMLVAGDHALNDMAGDDEESWKNTLVREGYKVKTYLRGLGENELFQEVYIQHVKDAMDGIYQKYMNMDL